jgi:ribosome-associated protein
MIAASYSHNEQVTMQNDLNKNLEQNTTASKTCIKKEMHALQKIGERLVELNPKQLAEFCLPDTLMDAIITAKQIHKHGAQIGRASCRERV